MVQTPRGEYGIQYGTREVESRHQRKHQIYNIQNNGRLNSEKTYLWRTHEEVLTVCRIDVINQACVSLALLA